MANADRECLADSVLQPWILPELQCDGMFETYRQLVSDIVEKICYKH